MGLMVWQSWPAGQHKAAVIVDVVFRDRQVVPVEQQKSEGKEPPHASRPAPQVLPARLNKSSDAQNVASCCSSSGTNNARADASASKQKAAIRVENMTKTLALKMRGYIE